MAHFRDSIEVHLLQPSEPILFRENVKHALTLSSLLLVKVDNYHIVGLLISISW